MRQKLMTTKDTAEQAVRDIRRKTRKQYSAEEKIRIVLEGLRDHLDTNREAHGALGHLPYVPCPHVVLRVVVGQVVIVLLGHKSDWHHACWEV